MGSGPLTRDRFPLSPPPHRDPLPGYPANYLPLIPAFGYPLRHFCNSSTTHSQKHSRPCLSRKRARPSSSLRV